MLRSYITNIFCYCCICLVPTLAIANESTQDDDIQISVLSCAPGDAIYALYGHTAIRVLDQTGKDDWVYNYGVFRLSQDGFAWQFMRGKAQYELGRYPYQSFLQEYAYDRRSVAEQVLNLDTSQKQKLLNLLKENYKPANRYYQYDFFYDNCATRVIDLIREAFTDLDDSGYEYIPLSFRDMIHQYQRRMPWLNFGIDLIIGSQADQLTSPLEQCFLPDYLYRYIMSSKVIASESLVKKNETVLNYALPDKRSSLFTPIVIFIILLILELFIFYRFREKSNLALGIYDGLWLVTVALSSGLMLFMWFGTDHQACSDNCNLIWMNPLFIGLALAFFLKRLDWLWRILSVVTMLFLLLSLAFWSIIPQSFHMATVPIILILLLKLIRQYGYRVI